MRRMAGLQLDGWHDHACRGWSLDGEVSADTYAELVEGGYASVIVSQKRDAIGGPQAIHSPIGRGGGWGQVGYTGRRRLAALWSDFLAGKAVPSWTTDIRAAADALTRQAQDIVLCIPDRPEMDEARQQALLTALAGPKRPQLTLLWRPVAMTLDWLATTDGCRARDGMRVACLQHASDGFELQYLTLRALPSEGGLLVPERAGCGHVIAPHLGLQALHDAAEHEIARENGLLLTSLTGRPRLPADQLFGPCPSPTMEVFRLENGDWRLINSLKAGGLPDMLPPLAELGAQTADIILLSTPLAARHHAWLCAAWVTPQVPVQLLDLGASASGSLRAARRIARGTPHYLDRLDQISLVVLRQGEPVFEDLIPANAVVAGDKEYVSSPITNMVWGRDMASAQFFLRKGDQEIRRWVTPDVPAPDADQPLVIQLRQRPAQGWAALTIGSRNWDYLARNPIRLDWTTLRKESRPEQEILASLRRPRPIVPDRFFQTPGMLAWEGLPGRDGLSSVLAKFDLNRPGDLSRLAQMIRANPRSQDGSRSRPIGTNGELPEKLSREDQLNLHRVIDLLADHLGLHVSYGRVLPNNDLLLALTWMYELCPPAVVREIICAVNCSLDGHRHVFLAPKQSTTIVMHGAGRVIRDPSDLINLIPKLLKWISSANSLNNGLGLLAGLLSRPKIAPIILNDLNVEKIALVLSEIFIRITRNRYAGSRLKYMLISIVSLIRVRDLDPWVLVADRSIGAALLIKIMREDTAYLHNPRTKITTQSIAEVIKMLQGEGGRPDIFSILDEIEE